MNDRGRVPFALIGVLLLVSSATVAVNRPVADRTTDPGVERAVEAVRADLVGALRHSARAAGRTAARHPVVAPADTPAGRRLDDPFRDALRLRVYHRFRRALAGTEERAGDAVAVARLPATSDASRLDEALERTSVRRAGPNGTALRVAVANVTIVVRRGGQVVERLTVSPSVVVGSPVLLVHDRVARFERRLNAPVTDPGLGRRLSARLYPLAWTRGYAQYGGAPVANVVGTRHVALATNDALLASQRAAFGGIDPAAESELSAAAARVGAADLAEGTGVPAGLVPVLADGAGSGTSTGRRPGPEVRTRVQVGRHADEAFRSMLRGRLSRAARSAYAVRARLEATVTDRSTDVDRARRPEGNWTLVGSATSSRVHTDRVPVTAGEPESGWHPLWSDGRRVERVETTRRRWRNGDRTRVTTTTRRTAADVTVRVLGDHRTRDPAPARPVERVHRRGGPLDGPNLADVESRAVSRLVTDSGGIDALAERALAGDIDGSPVRVVGDRPDGFRRWIARDLMGLRERVRNVSVSTRRSQLGTYRVDPAAELATALRDRRAELVGPPPRYGSAAERARYAARAAYLDRVLATLEQRSAERASTRERFVSVLEDHGTSLSALAAAERSRGQTAVPEARSFGGVGGDLRLRVDAAPAYLSVRPVPGGQVPADVQGDFTGLETRNRNLFTLPYADLADTVVGELFGGERVRLRTAARALRAVETLPPDAVNESVRSRRVALRGAVNDALARVRFRYRDALGRHEVGDGVADRRAVVSAGLAGWDSPAARALAVANGSAAAAIHAAALRRASVGGALARDRLRLALRATGRRAGAGGAVTVGREPVRRATAQVRSVASVMTDAIVERAAEAAADRTAGAVVSRAERRLGRSLARVPAGLPVTPVPAYWYATTNVWTVDVGGRYARLTVRATRGSPGRAVAYTRDGHRVRLDWDGDDQRELLGRASRVRFETATVIAVVVPPGGQGVGDVDGDADERSPGFTGPT